MKSLNFCALTCVLCLLFSSKPQGKDTSHLRKVPLLELLPLAPHLFLPHQHEDCGAPIIPSSCAF
jgi:hypothetical protein